MIVSFKHQFVFIKNTKTAGTSIELSLSRFCGAEDIVTPVAANDELLRPAGAIKPQRYQKPFPWKYSLQDFYRYATDETVRNQGINLYGPHSHAADVKNHLGAAVWNSLFKFTVERNPWDKAVSAYFFHRHLKNPDLDFEQFIREKSFYNSSSIYTDVNGQLLVDKVIRFEHLADELSEVCRQLHIPYDGLLPSAKGNLRKEKKHYREYYTDELKNIVADKCKNVIDLMGYTF